MEEEIKGKIADYVVQICKEYEQVLLLLGSIPGTNAVLQQYQKHVSSTLQYAGVHYMDAASIDLVACKQRHDPVRLLIEVESRFKSQEQGFYQLFPNNQLKEQIQACFEATKSAFDSLESCLSAIP